MVIPLECLPPYVWSLKLISKPWFSYCLFSRTYGQQHGSNQHCSVAVKLKTCLWLYSHAKSPIPRICLLASLNNVWRGILIRLDLIKELPICITQGHSLSVHKLERPGYLLVKLFMAATLEWAQTSLLFIPVSVCLGDIGLSWCQRRF